MSTREANGGRQLSRKDISDHAVRCEAFGQLMRIGAVAVIAERIRDGVEAGVVHPFAKPEEAARALCWMNNQYLLERFVDRGDDDVEAAVDVLHEIWKRAILYRETAEAEPGQ